MEQQQCSNPKCQTSSTNLKKCTRCYKASYCNRECQSQHWKLHKKECTNVIINEVHTPYPDQPRNLHHESKEINRKAGETAKATKKALKQGIPIITLSSTAQGMVIPNAPLPAGVPSNFALKQQAQNYFATGVSSKEGNLGNLKYEKVYRDYYDGILELEEEWMTFFSHVENYIHAENTCGILGTLATVYRQRGDEKSHKICEQVLDMEEKVLKIYKASADAIDKPATYHCYEGLEYKYNIIRFNLFLQHDRLKESEPIIRKLLEFEVKKNLDFDSQNYLWVLTAIGVVPSPENVFNLTKGQIRKLLQKFRDMQQSHVGQKETQEIQQRVALMQCSSCGVHEGAIGEFKACSRCDKIYYCSRDCQKKDWKSHKKVCNKK